jgi:hypothetical protein
MHAAVDVPVVETGDVQRQGDVVEDAAVQQQLVVLEHHADGLAVAGYGTAAQAIDVRPSDGLPAPGGTLHEHDQAQQRALARTGVAGEKHQLLGRWSKLTSRSASWLSS